jgi:putative methyltransferase (TIGR04325 family)
MQTREMLKLGAYYALGGATRLRAVVDREPYFSGAFPTLDLAIESLPDEAKSGYDSDEMPEVALDMMLGMLAWDYPVTFWLDRLQRQEGRLSLLDAGGHVGTKHNAFGPYVDLTKVDWTVWDLPTLLRAGRKAQADGLVSKDISFAETPADAGEVDLLLASGLMQYLDISFTQLVDRMTVRPRWVLLNKVATRPSDDLVTLQLIGKKRVPYQMRHKGRFEDELRAAGYEIRDTWSIPCLAHRIGTHPWLGESESRGYFLELV